MKHRSGSAATVRNSALLDWYGDNSRDLPWRGSSDPYRILVSEVMAQQTQIHRVVPRYERFLQRFPTLKSLAEARLRDVLSEWSGLGYPARARRLWETARMVQERGWPETSSGLTELPGIGPYTAAALGSFAFGRREAAVDTNLRRVLSRWEGEVLDGSRLRDVAGALVPEDAAAWNQAVMDLAASHCRPRAPRCEDCPVRAWCADPSISPAVPRQERFEGSQRQVRGAVLRSLGSVSDLSKEDLIADLPHDPPQVAAALESLVADGMVTSEDDRFRLGV